MKQNTIDMHLHTYYSDGTLSPRALLERALKRGVKTLAITDHDGISGIEEALFWGEKLGIEVIPGIEFSADLPFDEGGKIMNTHILGYEIDYKNKELIEAIEGIRKQRTERNGKLLKALNNVGYDIEEKDLYDRPKQDYVGKPNFALALVKKGYIKTTAEANTKGIYLRHPKVRAIHREKISAKKAIELIENAGGYSVLAHPMKLKYPKGVEGDKYELLKVVLNKLISYGLSGMECKYSTHSKEEEQKLLEIAKDLSLIATAGSDFHGPEFSSKVEIGKY